MDLVDATRALLPRLPLAFEWHHVVRYLPEFFTTGHARPDLAEQMRAALDHLTHDDVLEATARNAWRRPWLPATKEPDDHLDIDRGEVVSRRTIARILDLRSTDALRRGLFKRAKGPYRNHLFLFHDERAHTDHADRHPGHIRFTGQGLRGDQLLAHFNRDLQRHLDLGLQVHYFVTPNGTPGRVRYEGEVAVRSVRRLERPDGRRSVLEYTLVRSRRGETATEYGKIFAQILDTHRRPRLDSRVVRLTPFRRALHDTALRTIVLAAYGSTCSVCGARDHDLDDHPDIDAVGLVQPAERGPYAVQNALALCAHHGWALRHGRFTITDTGRTEGTNPTARGYGKRLRLPSAREWHPHRLYVRHHRRKWRRVARSIRDAPLPFQTRASARAKPKQQSGRKKA